MSPFEVTQEVKVSSLLIRKRKVAKMSAVG
jgi:hypothetical protein